MDQTTVSCAPDSVEIQLPHVEQTLSWDCGVSCVAMVLSAEQRSDLLLNRDQIGREEGYHQSTWTIDLCYLLRRFGVDHVYATVTLGVNPMFQKECYYKKSLQWDFQRVEDRFRDAASHGLTVCQRSTTVAELLDHLGRGGPVIVLVDHGQLHCDSCQKNKGRRQDGRGVRPLRAVPGTLHRVVWIQAQGEEIPLPESLQKRSPVQRHLRNLRQGSQAPGHRRRRHICQRILARCSLVNNDEVEYLGSF
ncbi:hypothetical protein MTO96_012434 [Rhipicephalus appendiculatus]